MTIIQGQGVSKGVAFGKAVVYQREKAEITKQKIQDVAAELERVQGALATATQQLAELYAKAVKEAGEDSAQIFEIHQMMLADGDFTESIESYITDDKVTAEYAVSETAKEFAAVFKAMDDEYMQERAVDVMDISTRVTNILLGRSTSFETGDEQVILFADDLVPSETIQLDTKRILAFVTQQGSTNSHTAILSRTMSIPAIIGIGDTPLAEYDGKDCIVDGFTGKVYLEPDSATVEEMKKRKAETDKRQQELDLLIGKENITIDGQEIEVHANVSGVEDIDAVLGNDAGGIGLFRSEFVYLSKDDYPTEEEQFVAYKKVVEALDGKRVIIRTLDIGADKQIDYFQLDEEENPALGYRAIRICLDRPEIFHTQLRAIFRASHYGKVGMMFPMVISVEEVKEAMTHVEAVKAQLREEEIPFDENMEIGIMIETPAAAIISDKLAEVVDFFSVGTNDLTQYTLAIDRQNAKLERFYDPHHPALLRLLQMVTENAHANGIWVGICGELGADLELTETFLSLGIDELSVSPGSILPLREKIRNTDVSKVELPDF